MAEAGRGAHVLDPDVGRALQQGGRRRGDRLVQGGPDAEELRARAASRRSGSARPAAPTRGRAGRRRRRTGPGRGRPPPRPARCRGWGCPAAPPGGPAAPGPGRRAGPGPRPRRPRSRPGRPGPPRSGRPPPPAPRPRPAGRRCPGRAGRPPPPRDRPSAAAPPACPARRGCRCSRAPAAPAPRRSGPARARPGATSPAARGHATAATTTASATPEQGPPPRAHRSHLIHALCGPMRLPCGQPTRGGSAAMAEKYVYDFQEGNREMKDLLGGKGANLAEMTNMGLPVPHGFTVTCAACNAYRAAGREFPDGMLEEVAEHLEQLEKGMGRRLGDPDDPLLVSVRSGAPFSMPGMMDTVLNLGLNDESVEGLGKPDGVGAVRVGFVSAVVADVRQDGHGGGGRPVRGGVGARQGGQGRPQRRGAGRGRPAAGWWRSSRPSSPPRPVVGSPRTPPSSSGAGSRPCSGPGTTGGRWTTGARTRSTTRSGRRSISRPWCSATRVRIRGPGSRSPGTRPTATPRPMAIIW